MTDKATDRVLTTIIMVLWLSFLVWVFVSSSGCGVEYEDHMPPPYQSSYGTEGPSETPYGQLDTVYLDGDGNQTDDHFQCLEIGAGFMCIMLEHHPRQDGGNIDPIP